MSGIVVKNVDMPKGCYDCPARETCPKRPADISQYKDSRPDDCIAFEVREVKPGVFSVIEDTDYMSGDFMTAAEVVEFLGYADLQYAATLAREGKIEKVGHNRYLRSSVEAFKTRRDDECGNFMTAAEVVEFLGYAQQEYAAILAQEGKIEKDGHNRYLRSSVEAFKTRRDNGVRDDLSNEAYMTAAAAMDYLGITRQRLAALARNNQVKSLGWGKYCAESIKARKAVMAQKRGGE